MKQKALEKGLFYAVFFILFLISAICIFFVKVSKELIFVTKSLHYFQLITYIILIKKDGKGLHGY